MKKVMTVLFYINLICWVSFMIISCIVKTDLTKTLFLVFNATMTFFGAWVSGYYFRKYEHSKKSGDDDSLDALKYAKKVCDSEEQAKHDEFVYIVETQRLYAQSKDKKICRKCVNCKYRKGNHCNYFDGTIVKNINWFNKCKRFKEKD